MADAAMILDGSQPGLDTMEIERRDAADSSLVVPSSSLLAPFAVPPSASAPSGALISSDLDMEYDVASSQSGPDSHTQQQQKQDDHEMDYVAEEKSEPVTTDIEVDLAEEVEEETAAAATTGMPEDHAEHTVTGDIHLEDSLPDAVESNKAEFTDTDQSEQEQDQLPALDEYTEALPEDLALGHLETAPEPEQPQSSNNIKIPSEQTNQESTTDLANNKSTTDTLETTTEPPQDDYTDAIEPHSEPVAVSSVLPSDFVSTDSPLRLVLQKDYLSAIDYPHPQPIDSQNVSSDHFVPHVSLLYQDLEYSLFRPSSTPSGDDEAVLFGEDEALSQGSASHSLYYAPLSALIDSLHQAFPTLKGDGEFEAILDFGFLDMQVTQDNVYCNKVSLFDLDRIRMGLCQPEFDRLQVTLKPSKRFAFRFNELAEHCYRMYAGSDDDSATINNDALGSAHDDFSEEAGEDAEVTAEAFEAPAADLPGHEEYADLPELDAREASEREDEPTAVAETAFSMQSYEDAQNEHGAIEDEYAVEAHEDVHSVAEDHCADADAVDEVEELEEYVEEEVDATQGEIEAAGKAGEGQDVYEDAVEPPEEEYTEDLVSAELVKLNGHDAEYEEEELVEHTSEGNSEATNGMQTSKDVNASKASANGDVKDRKRSIDKVEETAGTASDLLADKQSIDLTSKRTKLTS